MAFSKKIMPPNDIKKNKTWLKATLSLISYAFQKPADIIN